MKPPSQSSCDVILTSQSNIIHLKSSSDMQYLSTGQLITASNVEVVSPQIQQQQAEKSGGETLHWKDTAQKKQRRGSQQDATVVQSVLSVDAEKKQGNSNELTDKYISWQKRKMFCRVLINKHHGTGYSLKN
jgi:hypothetical protein